MNLSDGETLDYMTLSPPSYLTGFRKRGLLTSYNAEAILP